MNLHDPRHRARGRRHLTAADPRLAAAIARQGDRWPRRRGSRFELLCHIVIGQQLSVRAAGTIAQRLRAVAGGRLDPARIGALDDATIRGCGVSGAKLAALRDLSRHVTERRFDPAHLHHRDDDEVRALVGSCRGLGPWSVDMFLLFGLGRSDVWATGDLGLRRAVQILDGRDRSPTVDEMIERAEAWRPWRGLASLTLWGLLEAVTDTTGTRDKPPRS